MHIHIRFSSTKKYKKYGSISMHIYRDRTKLIITAETLHVKQWASPAPPAAIQRWRQSHGTDPVSGANRHRPSIRIPTAVRRRCPLPDNPYSCERSWESAAHNPPPAGFLGVSLRRISVAALRPYTKR